MALEGVDKLAAEIASGLEEYSDEVTKGIKKATDEVAQSAVKELKGSSPQRTGKYSSDWRQKKAYEDTRSKRNTVYNNKRYQLSHLLEFGHINVKTGRRVAAKEHIKPVEDKAIADFEQKIKEVAGG